MIKSKKPAREKTHKHLKRQFVCTVADQELEVGEVQLARARDLEAHVLNLGK